MNDKELIILIFENLELSFVLLCSMFNLVFGSRNESAAQRAGTGALAGVLILVAVSIYRLIVNSQFDFGDLPWGWITFGIVVFLIFAADYQNKEEIKEEMKSTSTLVDFVEYLQIKLSVPAAPLPKNIVDQASNYAVSVWKDIIDAIDSNDKEQEAVLERSLQLFEKKLFSMLPEAMGNSWRVLSEDDQGKIYKEFIEMKVKK